MAAPTKEGLDYFSFDVDLLDNDDLDFLREQYGVVVNDVYIALLTLLYRKKGYYIPYTTDAEQKDCVWYIYKRVRGGKHPIQQGLIPTVIEALVAQGLFDSAMFNQNDHAAKIITSERAQKTYYKATVERKLESFNIIPEFWMLNEETMRKLSKTHPYYLSLHPESKSEELPNKSDELLSKSDEKLVKESKVNNTSYKESKKENIKRSIMGNSKNFSEMSDEELLDYCDSLNRIPFEDTDFSELHALDEELKLRAQKRSNFKGKVIVNDGRIERLKSYDEIIDSFGISDAVRRCLYAFIRHCHTNKRIVTNDKLEDLLMRLMEYKDDKERIHALNEAINMGYFDIKLKDTWMNMISVSSIKDDK